MFLLKSENDHIQQGDTVIAYISPENKWAFKVTQDGKESCRVGAFSHSNMIGLDWGSKIISDSKKGFLTLLKPSPELWTRTLKHRTQILYTPDISFIEMMLDLKIGSRVIESGTGSGSFSHSLIRSIAPKGHLYTFEYHLERYNIAKQEFIDHGLDEYVSIFHRNVCKDGFGDLQDIEAVFLDLPSPWEAIPFAKLCFKSNSTIKLATFSPCIEQVVKTLEVLQEQGFKNIQMFEVLVKQLNVFSLPEWKPLVLSESDKKRKTIQDTQEEKRNMTSQCSQMVKGHTSYLVFATYLSV